MLRALRNNGAEVCTILLIGLVIAALQFAHWPLGEPGMGSGWDSGIFAYCGHVLAETHQLYAYCTDNKPPGIFLLNALASKASTYGTDWRAIWTLTWFAQTLAWVGVGKVAIRAGASQDGWLVAAVGAVSTFIVLDGAATVEIYSMPLQVIVAGAVYCLLSRPDRGVILCSSIAGAALAALFVMRTNNVAAGVLVLGLCIQLAVQGNWRRAFAIALSTFVAMALALTLLLFMSGGMNAVRGTMEFALSQGVSYLATHRESRLAAAASNLLWASSLFVLFAGAVYLERSAIARASDSALAPILRHARRTPWIRLLSAWMVVEVAFSTASARRYPHYSQMLLVPMALLLAEFLDKRTVHVEDSERRQFTGWPALRRVIVVVLGCLVAVLPIARSQMAEGSEGQRLRVYARRIAGTLSDLGASKDGVFLWGAPPSIYVFLGTAAPVRHIAPLTLATPGFTKPQYFVETIGCLAGSAPEFIVDAYDGTTVGLQRGRFTVPTLAEPEGFDQLRAFVKQHYTRERLFVSARTALWRRSSTVLAMRDSSGVESKDCRPHAGTWRMHLTP